MTVEQARKWQRRKKARPSEILDAAAVVFVEKGYSATRMADIATLAGVTKGTIYLYFASKAEVFRSVSSRRNAQREAFAAKTFALIE